MYTKMYICTIDWLTDYWGILDWFVLTKNVRLTTTSIVLVQTEPQKTDVHPRRRSSSLCPPQHRWRHDVPTTPHRPPSLEPRPRPSTCGIGTALIIPSSIIASGHVVRTGSGNGAAIGRQWLAKTFESRSCLYTYIYFDVNLLNYCACKHNPARKCKEHYQSK